jgi:hypothetical protein
VIDVDTFLTALYVMVDNFCQSLTQKERRRPGPDATLSPSERWLHSPSSPAGAASLVSGTSTATQTPTCATPFQPCLIARNSTGWCGFGWSSSRTPLCTWRRFWALGDVPTKPWTALRCLSGTRSEGVLDGWPDRPTSDGPTAWDGMRDSACLCAAIPEELSPALASPLLPPKTNRWPRLSCRAGSTER